MNRPTVPEVQSLVAQIYERNSVGCCLHIALEDGNLKERHLQFCLQTAIDARHPDCQKVARKMLQMSASQRRRVRAA